MVDLEEADKILKIRALNQTPSFNEESKKEVVKMEVDTSTERISPKVMTQLNFSNQRDNSMGSTTM